MSWMDDDDERREKKADRAEILQAKAVRFFDSVFASVSRDVLRMKEKHRIDISVLRTEVELIIVSKKMPYPTFSVQAHLRTSSESIRIEWSYQAEQDQKMSRREETWHLSLDSGNALHVTKDNEEIDADNASERMLTTIYDKR